MEDMSHHFQASLELGIDDLVCTCQPEHAVRLTPAAPDRNVNRWVQPPGRLRGQRTVWLVVERDRYCTGFSDACPLQDKRLSRIAKHASDSGSPGALDHKGVAVDHDEWQVASAHSTSEVAARSPVAADDEMAADRNRRILLRLTPSGETHKRREASE